MDSLAAPSDLEAISGRFFIDAEAGRVARLLEMASGLVRGECRQELSAHPGDVVTLPGTWDAELLLPEFPVVAVTSVTADGVVLDPSSYTWNSFGVLYRACSTWGGRDVQVAVTYDHGYTLVPDEIVAVVCGVVNGQLSNPTGARSETIGQRSISFAGDGSSIGAGLQLAGYQRSVLAKYKRRAWTLHGEVRPWPVYH